MDSGALQRAIRAIPGPKRGSRLFDGTDYPRTWAEYIGQVEVVDYVKSACISARKRNARLDHMLIACGAHGVGKTALARLTAQEMGVGLLEVQGSLELRDALRHIMTMSAGDILFIDEIHQLVAKKRTNAEWLLSLLQDGVIVTTSGVQPVPDITVVGATTDPQKLQQTILSRFQIKPVLAAYTDEQAREVTRLAGIRVFNHPELLAPNDWVCMCIAQAGNNNPREMIALLRVLRDSALAGKCIQTTDGAYSLDVMWKWSGVSWDGLDALAQSYLEVMFLQFNGKASEKSIAAVLGEPTPPRHTEQMLHQRNFIKITPSGRELTPDGFIRAQEVVDDRHPNRGSA